MKSLRPWSILSAALGVALAIMSATTLHAQPQISTAQLAALTPLDQPAVPPFGNFWMLQGPWPGHDYPPLPFLADYLTNAPVYALDGGHFLVDDRQVDYGAVREQREMDEALSSLEAQYGLRRKGLDGGTLSPMELTSYTVDDLWLEMIAFTNATGYMAAHPPVAETADGVYDLLMTTSLSPDGPGLNLTNWYWLLRTGPGETNLVVPGLPAEQGWFLLARTNDADADGLSDALERWVTHTDPGTPDANPFPVIISQPLSQSVVLGDSVTFTIQATGRLPLNYQWQFTPAVGVATSIVGATSPSLILNDVGWDAAGSYSVLVFNAIGWTVSSNADLAVANRWEEAVTLTGPRQDYTFKGDTTYYVEGSTGPVELYGTTKLEGGAVIKYSTNAGAKLVVKGPLICQTSPWRPAIFTAQDDDLAGWPLLVSTGTPTNFYAPAALEMDASADRLLKHVRIAYAQTAVHYLGSAARQVTGTVRHAQIVHCGAGFVAEGTASQLCVLNLANVLLSDVGQGIGGAHFRGAAEYLTVDRCNTFASDGSSSALGLFVTNSVFGDVTALGAGTGLDGSNNGFYSEHSPQFGTGVVVDDQPPFAPTGGLDEEGTPYICTLNGQAAYYLREDSPFEEAATTNIETSLKADFAQMTTAVPPDLFSDDINSSMTLGPTAVRDPGAASLGYHYPVVDYVLMLATVNNATLNIDQGTVLAMVGCPFLWGNWGLRLNPGGRLNVNGVPTNHVVFAHLEALQENPVWELGQWGPMITWRGVLLPSGFATPYPEAKLHYTDFPTISGPWNVHLGPISDYLSLSYSVVANLELDGCHLQGGWFYYDDGGPQGRTVALRNTVFDGCAVGIYDMGGYAHHIGLPEYPAAIAAANNLFHQCPMLLYPVPGENQGMSWTFTDNVFDNASFYTDQYGPYNGPVGANHNNCYVGMATIPDGANRLAPAAPTTTDPDLFSLSYETGPLGSFYLPVSATNLIAKGSRLASAAGEYHFTCLTNNAKAATGQVSIGPHYLAFVSGGVPDSNADGIPDFLADRNGSGTEDADEAPWQTLSTGDLVVLSPSEDSMVAGVIPVRFAPGTNSADMSWVDVLLDGASQLCSSGVAGPARSTATLEVDTTFLTGGPHALSLRAHYAPTPDGSTDFSGYTVESPAVSIVVTSAVRYPCWQDQAELAVKVDVETDQPSPEYTLWFFNSGYPKARDPLSPAIQIAYYQDVATNGIITYSQAPAFLGFGDGDTDPDIYSFTEFSSASSGLGWARANRNTRRLRPFPPLGKWVVSYEMDSSDYWWDKTNKQYRALFDPKDTANNYYLHDDQLGGWLGCALISADYNGPLVQAPGGERQTWPVRDRKGRAYRKDSKLLLRFLADTNVVNFYGTGHGQGAVDHSGYPAEFGLGFMGMSRSELERSLKNRRYRFVFLDGCMNFNSRLLSAFGADAIELPQDSSTDPGPLELSAYTDNLRPGAFLSWNANVPVAIDLPRETLDDFGRPCIKQVIPGLCFFHGQLTSGWAYGIGWGPLGLWDAIFWAKYWTTQLFTPEELRIGLHHLRHRGYRELRCTEYNHAGDWPSTPGP